MEKVIDIKKFRDIVDRSQSQKIGGMFVDLYSASAVVHVYDHLPEDKQQKLMRFPVEKIISVSFKCLKK